MIDGYILVTGCAGFIGSHLCEFLLQKEINVIGIDNFDNFYERAIKKKNLEGFCKHKSFIFYEADICNGLTDVIKENNIQAVVHLAAKAGVRPSIINPDSYIHTNIVGTQSIHHFMIAKGIDKLIFASSSSVYGNNKKTPFSESDNVDNPISPYAFTKKAGELMNHTLYHLYKKDVVNLRFFTVYGPRQRPDLAIHKFVKLISENQPIVIYGDGKTARDYTYIEDIVKGIHSALLFCINNKGVFTFNLGNNKPIELNNLVNTIYSALAKPKKLKHEMLQPGDVDITFADITLAAEKLKYSPSTNIEIGIRKFVEWFLQQ